MATAAEKIKALIAKALSTENEFPEEARTCALNAVRLIEKYKTGLNDVTPDWSPPPDARVLRLEQELHATQVRLGLVLEEKQRLVVRMSDLQSTLDHTLKRILELETEKRQAKPAKKKAATKGGKYRAVSFDVEDVDEDPGRTIVARYPSFCGQCRRSIQPGDHMWWRPNGKNLCSDCW